MGVTFRTIGGRARRCVQRALRTGFCIHWESPDCSEPSLSPCCLIAHSGLPSDERGHLEDRAADRDGSAADERVRAQRGSSGVSSECRVLVCRTPQLPRHKFVWVLLGSVRMKRPLE